ncbi:phytanoyl-CoA dioxygenase family protein [Sphingomonas sp.]|uniref:phytanoyl-CoA dioxygenase family protein n=1 Tax=Sphingomonas sp. TaxID=28214 RepID=UPI002FC60469
MTLTFARDGAELHTDAIDAITLDHLGGCLAHLPTDKPGIRLHGLDGLPRLLAPTGPVGKIARTVLGADHRPVRALLFDKSPATNWALCWHQDRTIAVAERIEVHGFRNWNVKAQMIHVEPPWSVLERMVTLRVHLDAVPANNAPLLIAPGSHRLGPIPERHIASVVGKLGTAACLAEAGDVWVYATPVLHASERATSGGRRRVLQVDFAVEDLSGGLRWLGV